MKNAKSLCVAAGLLSVAGAHAQQQSVATSLGLFVYPSAGQPVDQQNRDEQECYDWARQTTAIDPQNPPSGQRPPAATQEDTAQAAARGAVGTAARGVLLANATDNDWEQVAAAGLLIGANRGAKSARQRNAQAQQEAASEQQQSTQQEIQLFKNAFSACIEGRSYTIK
jgi:hypothetical protein